MIPRGKKVVRPGALPSGLSRVQQVEALRQRMDEAQKQSGKVKSPGMGFVRRGQRGSNWRLPKIRDLKKIAMGNSVNQEVAQRLDYAFMKLEEAGIDFDYSPSSDHQTLTRLLNKVVTAGEKRAVKPSPLEAKVLEKYYYD